MIRFINDHRSDHGVEPNRQFHAPAPNVLWVSDFTDVATWQGFVYVAFVIDVFAQRINFEAVEYATLKWVDWFNNRRMLEPIGNIPPAEAEASFCAALARSNMAA